MKRYAMIAVSAAALSLAACGGRDEPAGEATEASATDMATPVSDAMEVSPGEAFANTAAASDLFEIESSKLASAKATSAKIKSYADNMIKAHTDSTAKLKTAAGAATPPITPAPQLNPTQQQAMAELQAKTGADFDAAYKKAQVDAHQQALDALKAYSSTGDVASLKSFAAEMVPAVTGHLNMAKGL